MGITEVLSSPTFRKTLLSFGAAATLAYVVQRLRAAKEPAAALQDHSHDHGHSHASGSSHSCSNQDHGHSHEPAESSSGHGGHDAGHAEQHGHSHGSGHGDSAGHEQSHAHTHGGEPCSGHGEAENGAVQSHGHAHASSAPTGLAAQRAAMAHSDDPFVPNLSMALEEDLDRRLRVHFLPSQLTVVNEGGTCSAPKVSVVMVSDAFKDVRRVDRQRQVQALLSEDLSSNRIHALSLKLNTPQEYEKASVANQ